MTIKALCRRRHSARDTHVWTEKYLVASMVLLVIVLESLNSIGEAPCLDYSVREGKRQRNTLR